MRKNFPIALLLLALLNIRTLGADESQIVRIESVAETVKSKSFLVKENIKRLEQSGLRISEARARLYPQFNFWKALKIVFSPADWVSAETFIEVAQDIAPFLAPSRWFQLRQNEILYLAEREGARATSANAVMTAKALLFKIHQDREILEALNSEITKIEKLRDAAIAKEVFGSVRNGLSSKIELRLAGFMMDKRRLEALIANEMREFSFALGMPAETNFIVQPMQMPELARREKIESSVFVNRALNASPEVGQFRHFIRVIPFVKKEVKYSWLGLAKASRGTAGGVFDQIAVHEEISFGNKWTQEILKRELDIFNLRLEGASETVERQVQAVVDNYNLRLDLEKNANERLLLSSKRLASLEDRVRRGDDKMEIMDIVDAIQDHLESKFALIENNYGFMQAQDRLERLLFQGDYPYPMTLSGFNDPSFDFKSWKQKAIESKGEVERLNEVDLSSRETFKTIETYFRSWLGLYQVIESSDAKPSQLKSLAKKLDGKTLSEMLLISNRDWDRINEKCYQEKYYVCPEEVRVYPEVMSYLFNKLSQI